MEILDRQGFGKTAGCVTGFSVGKASGGCENVVVCM